MVVDCDGPGKFGLRTHASTGFRQDHGGLVLAVNRLAVFVFPDQPRQHFTSRVELSGGGTPSREFIALTRRHREVPHPAATQTWSIIGGDGQRSIRMSGERRADLLAGRRGRPGVFQFPTAMPPRGDFPLVVQSPQPCGIVRAFCDQIDGFSFVRQQIKQISALAVAAPIYYVFQVAIANPFPHLLAAWFPPEQSSW